MAPTDAEIAAGFIEGAPPGELAEIVADIKALTGPALVADSLGPAFERYNEAQFVTATLSAPGGSHQVLVSAHNRLDDGRYYDGESRISFGFDHVTQKASGPQTHVLESAHLELVTSLSKAFAAYANEHYTTACCGVYPVDDDSALAIVLVANKYSPQNFWYGAHPYRSLARSPSDPLTTTRNGRWRSLYFLPLAGPALAPSMLRGSINVDVHYYENGNVRLRTTKAVHDVAVAAVSAAEIVRLIARVEKSYQEEIGRAFGSLSEGAFKQLRRQLPVTRQKVEWEKVGTYRLGQDIGGARNR
ncbi:MAG: F-actin-capping protein subunit alpha [Phylliscum demangeonii]|nr:MAG: F-actin-capping protein subunit alpha [Phylliscum demangeonii]